MNSFNKHFLENKIELLNCNKNNVDFSNKNIDEELNLYYQSIVEKNNYGNEPQLTLKSWTNNVSFIYILIILS